LPLLSLDDSSHNELHYGAVYDLHGNRRDITSRCSGVNTADLGAFDEGVTNENDPEEPDPDDVRKRLRVRVVLTILRYQHSGRFTVKELRILYWLWLEGRGLREVARMEGVKPETLRQRIEGNRQGHGGVKKKAPEFYRWWKFRNRNRRRK
jgi:hypothetical protein